MPWLGSMANIKMSVATSSVNYNRERSTCRMLWICQSNITSGGGRSTRSKQKENQSHTSYTPFETTFNWVTQFLADLSFASPPIFWQPWNGALHRLHKSELFVCWNLIALSSPSLKQKRFSSSTSDPIARATGGFLIQRITVIASSFSFVCLLPTHIFS